MRSLRGNLLCLSMGLLASSGMVAMVAVDGVKRRAVPPLPLRPGVKMVLRLFNPPNSVPGVMPAAPGVSSSSASSQSSAVAAAGVARAVAVHRAPPEVGKVSRLAEVGWRRHIVGEDPEEANEENARRAKEKREQVWAEGTLLVDRLSPEVEQELEDVRRLIQIARIGMSSSNAQLKLLPVGEGIRGDMGEMRAHLSVKKQQERQMLEALVKREQAILDTVRSDCQWRYKPSVWGRVEKILKSRYTQITGSLLVGAFLGVWGYWLYLRLSPVKFF